MRYTGKITTWNDDKGFGFITPRGGGQQAFVHVKSFANRQPRPAGNERVTFKLKTDASGRPRAECVKFVDKRLLSFTFPWLSMFPVLFAVGFLVVMAWMAFYGNLPRALLWLYCGSSMVAFLAYALDKSAARKGKWRTQESTLHFFSLIGGWPGALIAQRLLRHKSRKRSFQILFWITVAMNCGAIGWLFSPASEGTLRAILDAV